MVSSNSNHRSDDSSRMARIYNVGSRAVVTFDWAPAQQVPAQPRLAANLTAALFDVKTTTAGSPVETFA